MENETMEVIEIWPVFSRDNQFLYWTALVPDASLEDTDVRKIVDRVSEHFGGDAVEVKIMAIFVAHQ